MHVGYPSHDQQRRLLDNPHAVPARSASPYERDRLRLLASPALHRLAAVTQVEEPDAGPVPHNRLTHSLHVAAIGVQIGNGIGADPALVEIGCLAHDLGHPPFGHNGEIALRTLARSHGLGFEANAQTLRILTHTAGGQTVTGSGGLNLCRASLDATIKYPWPPGHGRKYGTYPEDEPILEWIRRDSPAGRLCLEAQIMDTADDIANAVHDVTAGLRRGTIPLAALTDRADTAAFVKLAAAHFTTVTVSDIDSYSADLRALPALAAPSAAGGEQIPEMWVTGLARELTARFIDGVVSATHAESGPGPHRRFTTDLIVPSRVDAEIALLKAVHLHYVLRAPDRRSRCERQRAVLNQLVPALLDRAPAGLDPMFADQWARADNQSGQARAVFDQVASFTDRRAIETCRRLTGAPVPER